MLRLSFSFNDQNSLNTPISINIFSNVFCRIRACSIRLQFGSLRNREISNCVIRNGSNKYIVVAVVIDVSSAIKTDIVIFLRICVWFLIDSNPSSIGIPVLE